MTRSRINNSSTLVAMVACCGASLARGALAVFAFMMLAGGTACAASSSDFELLVKPYLEQNCISCHGPEKKKGKLTLHTVTDSFETEDEAEGWIEVLDMLSFEEMPPPEEDEQPDPLATAQVVGWIKQQLHEAGRAEAYTKKFLAPEYGNWVSHGKLFSGEIKTPPYSPSRLWRLSSEIFLRRGFHRSRSPFSYVTPSNGIRDYSAMSGVDRSTVQMILINTEQWLEHREAQGELKRFAEDQPTPLEKDLAKTVRIEFRRIIGREPNEEEHAKYLAFLKRNITDGGNLEGFKTTIKAMFLSPEAIYRAEFGLGETDEHGRRHLSSEEIAYALSFALTDRGPDHTAAIREAFAAGDLTSREDVARVVRQVLDEELWAGRWSHPGLPRVRRFFDEFFGFHRAGEVFKDMERQRREGIPQWNTQYMIHDARMLIDYVLREDKDVVAELLTTNQWFIAHPGDNDYAREFYEKRIAEVTAPGFVSEQVAKREEELEREVKDHLVPPGEAERRLNQIRKKEEERVLRYTTALEAGLNPHPNFPFSDRSRGLADLIYIESYNLPSSGAVQKQRWNWPVEQPLEMPKEQRAGLLTHPAWLAAHSLNEGNDPIRRGIWIREKLLAGVIQDVPPDVDANVPTDPHKTLRERLEVVRAERCWSCHRKINPLGETFEAFDDWGRYRTEVFFDEDKELVTRRDQKFKSMLQEGKLSTRPIDASGAITGSGDPKVDGDVNDAIELIHRLGQSDRARQSFIRHLFRYFMGRNELLSDSSTLMEAEQAYLANGGSFKALVVSLLSSDSFLYRR